MKNKFTSPKNLCFNVVFASILASAGWLTAEPAKAQENRSGKRAVKGSSWIDLQVATDKRRYVVGELIKVTLKATNIQEKDAYLKFSSGQRFEIKVFKEGQKEAVYVWSASRMFAMMTRTIKLALAERETYSAEIGSEMGELPPGKYRLEANLTNSSQIRALPIEFTVVPKTAGAGPGATKNGG